MVMIYEKKLYLLLIYTMPLVDKIKDIDKRLKDLEKNNNVNIDIHVERQQASILENKKLNTSIDNCINNYQDRMIKGFIFQIEQFFFDGIDLEGIDTKNLIDLVKYTVIFVEKNFELFNSIIDLEILAKYGLKSKFKLDVALSLIQYYTSKKNIDEKLIIDTINQMVKFIWHSGIFKLESDEDLKKRLKKEKKARAKLYSEPLHSEKKGWFSSK